GLAGGATAAAGGPERTCPACRSRPGAGGVFKRIGYRQRRRTVARRGASGAARRPAAAADPSGANPARAGRAAAAATVRARSVSWDGRQRRAVISISTSLLGRE